MLDTILYTPISATAQKFGGQPYQNGNHQNNTNDARVGTSRENVANGVATGQEQG